VEYNMKVKMEKLKLLEGNHSEISPGKTQSGDLIIGQFDEDGKNPEPVIDLTISDIEVGNSVLVFGGGIFNFVKTSPIVKILESSETYIKFETETSIYEIIEIEDES